MDYTECIPNDYSHLGNLWHWVGVLCRIHVSSTVMKRCKNFSKWHLNNSNRYLVVVTSLRQNLGHIQSSIGQHFVNLSPGLSDVSFPPKLIRDRRTKIFFPFQREHMRLSGSSGYQIKTIFNFYLAVANYGRNIASQNKRRSIRKTNDFLTLPSKRHSRIKCIIEYFTPHKSFKISKHHNNGLDVSC